MHLNISTNPKHLKFTIYSDFAIARYKIVSLLTNISTNAHGDNKQIIDIQWSDVRVQRVLPVDRIVF